MQRKYLKKAIGDWITELTSGIGVCSKVPKKKVYPYIHFKFSSSSEMVRGRDDIIMECDFWDDSEESETIADQAELVKDGLHHGWYSDTNGFFHMYLDFYADIPDTTPNMSRIQQRYIIKVR